MQIKNILFAAGLASALPASNEARAAPAEFTVMSLRSASNIHFSHISASEGRLFLNMAHSGATCDRKTGNSAATFYLSNGELHLYSTDNPPQQVWADRSGMGQGIVGYKTGAQSPPRNGELTGFEVDSDGNLTLEGAGFLACPLDNGKYVIWVDAGVTNPGGNKNCLGFTARTVEATNPNSCTYTSN